MGKPSLEEKERNLALGADYKLYKEGQVKMADLVEKYRISRTRIHQIGKKILGKV